MKRKGKTQRSTAPRAYENRKIRQKALREQLAAQKLLERIDSDDAALDKLRKYVNRLRKDNPLEAARIEHQIIKTQMDARFKKLNKILPDLKSQELDVETTHEQDPARTLEAGIERARQRARERQEREQAGQRVQVGGNGVRQHSWRKQ